MNSLEDKYSWEELAELTNKRIIKNLKPKKWKEKEFIDWFLKRKKVGYRFDWILVSRAYYIWKQLKNESDHFTVVVGAEGSGKTTIATQFNSWIAPSFSLKDICYTIYQFLQRLREFSATYKQDKRKNITRSLSIDEGAIDLFSREAMRRSNRILAKTFFIQRFLNIHVSICIPKFEYVDSIVRDHRVGTLISIKERGKYKCITGAGIKRVNIMLRKKDINRIQIPYGYFWDGIFSKRFPYTIDFEEYEDFKFKNIKSFLKDAEQEAIAIKMIKISRLVAELGISNNTLIRAIQNGEIEGKKIVGQWFITQKAYDKLLTP